MSFGSSLTTRAMLNGWVINVQHIGRVCKNTTEPYSRDLSKYVVMIQTMGKVFNQNVCEEFVEPETMLRSNGNLYIVCHLGI
jgi:hypothetical protein